MKMKLFQRLLSPSFGSFSKLIQNSGASTSEALTKDSRSNPKEPSASASEAAGNDTSRETSPVSVTASKGSSQEICPPSALFVPGNVAQLVTPLVIPHYKLSQLDTVSMEANLLARKYTLMKPLEKMVQAGAELEALEDKLEDIKCLRDLLKQQKDANDPEASETQNKIVSQRSLEKALTARKWEIEQDCVVEYLNLPNSLHPDTPTSQEDSAVIHQKELKDATAVGESHTVLCKDQLTFTDYGVYMEGDLALKELQLTDHANSVLTRRDFEMVSAPDITRSSVLEGCNPGCDVVASGAPTVALPMAGTSDFGDHGSAKGAHLVGSASLFPFVGQLSKNIVVNGPLPIRQFSIGRKYQPIGGSGGGGVHAINNKPKSLFEVSQSTCAEVFTASKDGRQMEAEFEGLVDAMRDFYDSLQVPYKMKVLPAAKLSPSQSKSVVVTVPTFKWRHPQVVVGRVSLYDDFISNRLMLMFDSGKPFHIAAGTFVNVTKMIGCSVEHNADF